MNSLLLGKVDKWTSDPLELGFKSGETDLCDRFHLNVRRQKKRPRLYLAYV